jgi:hypothetical protein
MENQASRPIKPAMPVIDADDVKQWVRLLEELWDIAFFFDDAGQYDLSSKVKDLTVDVALRLARLSDEIRKESYEDV